MIQSMMLKLLAQNLILSCFLWYHFIYIIIRDCNMMPMMHFLYFSLLRLSGLLFITEWTVYIEKSQNIFSFHQIVFVQVHIDNKEFRQLYKHKLYYKSLKYFSLRKKENESEVFTELLLYKKRLGIWRLQKR